MELEFSQGGGGSQSSGWSAFEAAIRKLLAMSMATTGPQLTKVLGYDVSNSFELGYDE